ncbi:ABC transporter substrate-binding protein [Corynebacterium phocae]|uniref:ABC transporter substrate-binding protein n=1 Tax=Corynebacterium phocae TaxID=161895 RepID=A0A1L7D556_9CORY|nr:extracellular solute-binding protein [Corynebacterium phocae]APT93269.1 ABC transporter substrate-binding protein [Corynebacterium phocae]KAA8721745.1 extracellular solute-binding protein [Corynebacterium phocae]
MNTRKAFAAVLAVVLGSSSLVACSGDESSSSAGGADGAVTLTVWTSQEEQTDDSAWLQTQEKAFEEANPDMDITWKNSVVSPADAGITVTQDPSAAADVYLFANDQLGALKDANAIGALSDEGKEQIQQQAEQPLIDSVTGTDGEVYGLPYEPNTWFMYYNKSKLSEEDVKSFDTMLEKAKVSFPLSNSWYISSFYAGAGTEFFGADGLDESAGIEPGAKADAVTKYLADVAANPNFIDDADGSGLGGLANGSVDVVFSGAWDAKAAKEALGDDYAVAAPPVYNLDGEEVQMKAFSGSKAVAYNPNSEHQVAAAKFAQFLASSESQKSHFELNGVIPSDKTLADDADISSDPVAVALFDTVANASILQPTFKAMSDFWEPAENFGKALVNGEVTKENAVEKTKAWFSAYK